MRLTNYNISDSYILGGEYALLASRKAYSRCKKGMSLNVEGVFFTREGQVLELREVKIVDN